MLSLALFPVVRCGAGPQPAILQEEEDVHNSRRSHCLSLSSQPLTGTGEQEEDAEKTRKGLGCGDLRARVIVSLLWQRQRRAYDLC